MSVPGGCNANVSPDAGPPESCFWSNRKSTVNRTLSSADCLVAGTPPRGMQPLPYLVQPVVLGARTLLDSLGLVWMAAALFACSRSALSRAACALAIGFSRRCRPLCLAASSRRRSASRRCCSFSKSAAGFRASRSLISGAHRFADFGATLFLPSPVPAGFLAPTADRSAPRKADSTPLAA